MGVHWSVEVVEMPNRKDQVHDLLCNGWEPFGVTNGLNNSSLLWLRKQVDDDCLQCRAEAAKIKEDSLKLSRGGEK
jgi:hypothetical protein